MRPVYPDLEWYAAISERKGLPGRCPFAAVGRCPRYFETVALLSDVGITTKLASEAEAAALAKWQAHDTWPTTKETAAAISGSDERPHKFSNFCPEVAFDTFKLFATGLIRYADEIDRAAGERTIEADGSNNGKDWRWNWQHIEALHYAECPVYAKLYEERSVTQINFNAPVSGQVNVAGKSINSPVMTLSVQDILTHIETSDATPAEKEAAKSKLAEFLSHPLVAAMAGGIVGSSAGLMK